MKTLTTTMLSAAFLCTALASHAQDAQTQCAPALETMRAEFPSYAIEKRQHGIVRLSVRLNEHGNVTEARVVESSGHASLDDSALKDVRRHWRFRVTHCNASELAQERTVVVDYRRPPGLSVSGTLNRKALARIRELHADQRCLAALDAHDMTVFACRESSTATLADARR